MLDITCSHTNTWSKYQHPSVHDLAWLLLSPSIMCGRLGGFSPFTIDEEITSLTQWLESLDRHSLCQTPNTFTQSITRNHHRRLGLYAEALLTFYFQQAKARGIGYQLLARNLQINLQGKTLGECDFLVRNPKGEIVHIELAVKYYLQIPHGSNQWQHWVGPNSRDRLDIKLERMMNHQLPLPGKQEVQAEFQEIKNTLNINSPIISQHLVKGYLFSHDLYNIQTKLPINANTHSSKGVWMRNDEFIQFIKNNQCDVIFCQKMDWLSGPDNKNAMNCPLEIEAHIASIYGAIFNNNENDTAKNNTRGESIRGKSTKKKSKKNAPAILLLIRFPNSKDFLPLMLGPVHTKC